MAAKMDLERGETIFLQHLEMSWTKSEGLFVEKICGKYFQLLSFSETCFSLKFWLGFFCCLLLSVKWTLKVSKKKRFSSLNITRLMISRLRCPLRE